MVIVETMLCVMENYWRIQAQIQHRQKPIAFRVT